MLFQAVCWRNRWYISTDQEASFREQIKASIFQKGVIEIKHNKFVNMRLLVDDSSMNKKRRSVSHK